MKDPYENLEQELEQELEQVRIELNRLQMRFWSLQETLARECPVCHGTGWVTPHFPCPRPIAGWGCCCLTGDCFTCGGKGEVHPVFHDGEGLVYMGPNKNFVEFDADGNDKEWSSEITMEAA